jgi:hypothetical protein
MNVEQLVEWELAGESEFIRVKLASLPPCEIIQPQFPLPPQITWPRIKPEMPRWEVDDELAD